MKPSGQELVLKGATGFILAPIAFALIIAVFVLLLIASPFYGYHQCVRQNSWFWNYFVREVKAL